MDDEPKFSGYISFGMMGGILLMGIGLGWGFGIDNVLNATSNFLYIFGIDMLFFRLLEYHITTNMFNHISGIVLPVRT